MKLLDIPHTPHDMVHSLSLTGITSLTQSRYKQRHSGSKETVQVPGLGFQKLSDYKLSRPEEFSKKKTLRRKAVTMSKIVTKISQMKQYRINKKQVIHRIRGYINAMKGEKLLYFWTITFPAGTSDDTAYILLNKLLTRLRQERILKDYLWIAERQQNGTIHYHMVVNQRMEVKKVNRFMRASIMYSIDQGEIDWTRQKAVKYNGIDICKDRKTKRVTNFAKQKSERSLSNYLTKYITKNDQSFSHLAWHSSRGYSNIIIAVRITQAEMLSSRIQTMIDRENPLVHEYFIHYRWKNKAPNYLKDYLAFTNNLIKNLLK